MESSINNCTDFANALGLKPGMDGLFIGKMRGFPIGLKFIDPAGATVLLFQIRHLLKADSTQIKALSYGVEIKSLLSDKKVEIEVEDRLAWLTFVEGVKCMAGGLGLGLLDSVLQTFEKAGLISNPDLCHYCEKEKVDSVICVEGKVAQICPTCLEDRLGERTRKTAPGTAEAVPILLLSPFASLVGALAWATIWAAYTLFFEFLSARTIYVPQILEIVVMLGIAFLVGGPVGWIIKQNRKRGGMVSVSMAVLFSFLAVAIGEILFLVWLIYHQLGVLSFSAAFHVMPDYYLHNDLIYLVTKALTAAICIGIAYSIAKPKKPKLNL